MRCLTPQIAWHNKDPVLSIDFDPSTISAENGGTTAECGSIIKENGTSEPQINALNTDDNADKSEVEAMEVEVAPALPECEFKEPSQSQYYRFATGGADSHLLVWRLSNPNSVKPELICVADLTRHLKSVNAVRFSPDGHYIASADDDAYICLWKCESVTNTEESWQCERVLRRHLEDISDLNWSLDCNFLLSGSVDNTAVLWDVKKGTAIHIWSEHGGLVQGVAYDPLGEFAISICSDRMLRLFNPKTGKVISRTLKYPKDWLNDEAAEEEENKDGPAEKLQQKSSSVVQANRVFHDDTLRTFCRRPHFSERGELLMIPGGLLPPNNENNSPGKKKQLASNHSAVVFCRNSFTNPCAVIPCGTSYSIACRFCPVYFHRNRKQVPYGTELVNSTKKSERTISCVGKLKAGAPTEETVLMNMPYRIVYAIATNNSVIIGDTESVGPLAVVGNIHCTRLTDLTWSNDGRVILVSSTDGFCSVISFEENELGTPYMKENLPELTAQCFPVHKLPVKEPNESKKKNQKEKEEKQKDAKIAVESPVVTPKVQKKTPKVPKAKKEPLGASIQVPKTLEIPKNKDEAKREATPPPNESIAPTEVITPTTEIKESLAKIKVTPQRNTLDRWIQKTPKSAEIQLMKEKKAAEADAKLQKELDASLPISAEELTKLKEAPIIVDLSDSESEIENGCLHTIPENGDLINPPTTHDSPLAGVALPSSGESAAKIESPKLVQPQSASALTSTSTTSVHAEENKSSTALKEEPAEPPQAEIKRLATSPISSNPTKQPRRVQLITLTSSAKKDELPQ